VSYFNRFFRPLDSPGDTVSQRPGRPPRRCRALVRHCGHRSLRVRRHVAPPAKLPRWTRHEQLALLDTGAGRQHGLAGGDGPVRLPPQRHPPLGCHPVRAPDRRCCWYHHRPTSGHRRRVLRLVSQRSRTPARVPLIVYDIPYRTGVTITGTPCCSWPPSADPPPSRTAAGTPARRWPCWPRGVCRCWPAKTCRSFAAVAQGAQSARSPPVPMWAHRLRPPAGPAARR
jgi:hypothetical protein